MDSDSKQLADIHRFQHEQMLRLVTQSFYRELKRYGIGKTGIVSISTHLLDYVTQSDAAVRDATLGLDADFSLNDIERNTPCEGALRLGRLSLQPLQKTHLPQLARWLVRPEIRDAVISLPSLDTEGIRTHFLQRPDAHFFVIDLHGAGPIGLIGAENIEVVSRKLEMKKFIGEAHHRGRGLGKLATLLFLFYVFEVLNFNKAYIHAIDTNIRNINLNTWFGFELEGVAYEDVFVQGRFRDVVRMGLLRSRWLKFLDGAARAGKQNPDTDIDSPISGNIEIHNATNILHKHEPHVGTGT